jgi:hypothetical protein
MANTYSITINLDDDTLDALYKSKWQLQAYKGVKGNPDTGKPTVWFKVNEFSRVVTLNWSEQFGGYVDSQSLTNGVIVNCANSTDMNLGENLTLNENGTIVTTSGGQLGAISIHSLKDTEWLCGVSQAVNGQTSPICAFPLFGHSTDVMAPYETVVLVFSQAQVDTGTVVEEVISQSVQIVLSGTNTTATLAYVINKGWQISNKDVNISINENPINLAQTLIIPMP